MRRALAARPPGPGKGIPQMKMTTEEALVKVLQMHGIEQGFGIIGSAFMPISDIFPKAGIAFWEVAHETKIGRAHVWTTVTNAHLVCPFQLAQKKNQKQKQ